jgi:SnoaL-like domain
MTDAADHPARFVDQFAQGWALPKPDAFFEYFAPLIAPDATFRQPLFPTAVGLEGFTQTFRPLFQLIPDLVANVQRWAAREDAVFIESTFVGTVHRTPVEFDVCDRFVLRKGIIAERTSYSDPMAILGTISRHPSAWPRAVRRLVAVQVRNLGARQRPDN